MNKPNIILITIDSLRPDFLGCYGSKKGLTHNIDKLADRSIVFKNAITPSAPTYLAFQSIMCGARPFKYGKYLGIPPANEVKTIAESMKENGYSTYAVVSDNPVLYGKNYEYNRGFDEFIDYKIQNIQLKNNSSLKKLIKNALNEKIRNKMFLLHAAIKKLYSKSPIVNAGEINKKALKLIGSNGAKPFFMWLHYMDVHTPYSSGYKHFNLYGKFSPKNLYAKIKFSYNLSAFIRNMRIENKEDLRIAMSMYEASLKYLDDEIGKLIGSINNDNTYIILTSDHGESFMEHGYYYHDTFSVYDELIKIPLLICGPGISHADKTSVASSLNIAKTICALAGIKTEHFEGFNLVNIDSTDKEKHLLTNNTTAVLYKCKFFSLLFDQHLFDNKAEIMNYEILSCIIKDGIKYIFNRETKNEELYDLKNDPGEKINIAEKKKDICSGLKKILMNQ